MLDTGRMAEGVTSSGIRDGGDQSLTSHLQVHVSGFLSPLEMFAKYPQKDPGRKN